MDAALARLVRSAAAEAGVSVSTWLSAAVKEKARQHALREALDYMDARHGAMSLEEAEQLVAEMRKKSIIVRPGKKRR